MLTGEFEERWRVILLLFNGCNPRERGGMNMCGVLKRKFKNQDWDFPSEAM